MANDKRQLRSWGGTWTEQRQDCFERYVRAYLTVMNLYREKKDWRLLYFDGFTGSGTRTEEEKKQEAEQAVGLFGEKLVAEELRVFQGAAERVVRLDEKMRRGFDFYYFIDLKEENCSRLELKLTQYPTKGYKVFRPGDADRQTQELGEALRRDERIKALALLDPLGMNIEWSSIKGLAGKSVDLWIMLPTGVIINRLLEKDGTLKHCEWLERIFGLGMKEIKNWFDYSCAESGFYLESGNTYAENVRLEWYEKPDNPMRLIADLYIERLGETFPFITNEPIVLRNRNKVPIYHMVCASFSQNSVDIAQELLG